MVTRSEVEFQAEDGVILRGWLFTPDVGGRRPAISMCHGFAAVKEHGLEPFARVFARAGFVVLVHDHRNFGASDGAPRHDIDPWAQLADWRVALGYLAARPEVDPDQLGIWGSSYSGGHALIVAASDRRVKCVVSQVPTISGSEQGRRRVRPEALPAFLDMLSADVQAQQAGAPPRMQAVASADTATLAAYRSLSSVAFYMQDLGGASWTNTVTLRSTLAARSYEPGVWISEIAPTPLLMIVASDDDITMTDLEIDAYARAVEPKRLVMVPGGHFTPYLENFSVASLAATDWFLRHLKQPDGVTAAARLTPSH
ncbi:MAG: alpha/beta hydrolase [Cupriavidus necator]